MLESRGLSARLGEQRFGGADGLCFRLEAGEKIALSGPSGAGKTTMLRAIAALIDADGELLFEGRPPAAWGYPGWRRKVCYVGQRPIALPGTVRENLALPFSFASVEGAFEEADAERRLRALGLDAFEREASALSGGELQRVHVLRALLLRPAVLLLDEPTASLDPASRAAVVAELEAFAEQGGALLVVSHDASLRAELADRELALAPPTLAPPTRGGPRR